MTDTVQNRRRQLKARLKRLGITQDAIAARAGCGRTYVNHFLNGRRSPKRLMVAVEGLLAEAKARANGDAA